MKTCAFLYSFWFLFPLNLLATTLPRLPVEDLYQRADVVAVVTIESGSVVANGEKQCGARYRGRILEAIKGPFKNNDVVEFGPFPGTGVGNQALVFLNDSAKVYTPKISTNSIAQASEAEYEKACSSLMPNFSIMFAGYGLLDIRWTSKFKYKDAVLFKDEWIAAPDSVEKKIRERGDDRIESTEYWVKVEDVVAYLRKLATKERAIP
jgi:hypothetical protein